MAARGKKERANVTWELLDQPLYDRLIEAMVYREHPDADVRPVDGRGGDGGLDILVLEPNGTKIVYQLKFFPEGFDGKHSKRREQIKRSLARACAEEPQMSKWVLVAPCVPSRPGWVFLDNLRKENGDIAIEFVHRTLLDAEWIPRHSEVVRNLLDRNELLEHAAIMNNEQSVLAGGLTDLVQRYRNLDEVAAVADPDWRWDVAVRDGGEIAVLTPRHPNADKASPVAINFEVDGSSGHGSVSAFRNAMDYGALDKVSLPGDVVRNFRIDGSELVRGSGHDEIKELTFYPIRNEAEPQPLAVALRDRLGASLGVFQGSLVDFAPGTKGSTIRQQFNGGCLELTWCMSFEANTPSHVDVRVDLDKVGASVAQVRGTCDLLIAFARSEELDLLVGSGAKLAVATGVRAGSEGAEGALTVIRQVADDLVYLEDALTRQFRWPGEFTDQDRIDLRITRRLLEGKVVNLPQRQKLTATLDPTANVAELNEWLRAGEHMVLAVFDQVPWHVLILEEQGALADFEFEQYAVCLPRAQIEDAERALESLRTHREAQVTVHSAEGVRTMVYDPSRHSGGDTATPLGLHDLEAYDSDPA